MTKMFLLDVLYVVGPCSLLRLTNHLTSLESFFSIPSWTAEEVEQLVLELVEDGYILLDN